MLVGEWVAKTKRGGRGWPNGPSGWAWLGYAGVQWCPVAVLVGYQGVVGQWAGGTPGPCPVSGGGPGVSAGATFCLVSGARKPKQCGGGGPVDCSRPNGGPGPTPVNFGPVSLYWELLGPSSGRVLRRWAWWLGMGGSFVWSRGPNNEKGGGDWPSCAHRPGILPRPSGVGHRAKCWAILAQSTIGRPSVGWAPGLVVGGMLDGERVAKTHRGPNQARPLGFRWPSGNCLIVEGQSSDKHTNRVIVEGARASVQPQMDKPCNC